LPKVETSPELRQKPNASGFFHGNAAVIALSSGIRSIGNFAGVYIPLYFVQIGGNPLTLGLLASVSSIIQFFTLSVGGFLADYYGRRKVIVFATFYGVFFPLLYAAVQDWRVFGALTVLATLGTISNPAVHAIVADSSPPERRTVAIANVQVASSFPSVMAPLIGGWLIQNYGLEDGFRLACIYAAAFAFISAIPVLVFLKETLRPKVADPPDFPVREVFFGFTKISANTLPSCLRFLMLSYALVIFANSAVAQYYILFASGAVGLSALDWGWVVSMQVLAASSLKIPGGWVSDRFGKRRIMIISLLITVPAILLFSSSRSFIQIVVFALLLVAAGIYYAPAYEALQADLTPRAMRGRTTAIWDMGNAASAALGSLVGGFTFQVDPALPFYVFAAAELVAALLLIKMVKEPERREI